MQEIVQQILVSLRGMWKFRWPGLVVAWVTAVVGVVAVWKIPDQFEASARIFVDTDSILKPLMSGLAVQPNVEQQIGMLSRTLISRPNIEKLIRMAAAGSLIHQRNTGASWQIPAYPTNVVEPCGAGNAYCGGFLVGWLQTGDLRSAGLYGAVAASFLLEQIGLPPAGPNYITLAQQRLAELQPLAVRIS